ncbi:histidine kinase [Vibrio coralliilyticus]|uniref:histidine kinase n=1 Tax=Vibrio coralliilyticus TaxID=190893 RepID=A0AAN0VWV2_9VIBR|nr:CHASE domain-containing protein [Vibrio coralliilyticus]AIW17781.1 histidine kinase [Vibrio coralliilyticus]NOH39846.1 histidine kinase [Vibrio coralliilyticus]
MLGSNFFAKRLNALNWYHWLVLCLSAALTFTAWKVTSTQAEQKAKTQFEFQANQLVELVQERMSKYEEALLAGSSALHMYENPVTRQKWKIFANAFDVPHHFPGINGIGVIHYVPEDKLVPYLDWQRLEFPDYNIHPSRTGDEYWPITYVEPIEENLKAVGLDMAHESNRYTAAKNARATHTATITGPIVLVQDSKKTPGFLFYVPWFSDSVPQYYGDEVDGFLGLVYAPFVFSKLMSGTLSGDKRLVNFSLYDNKELLYSDKTNQNKDDLAPPGYTTTIELNLYGRTWQFVIESSLLFEEQKNTSQPLLILTFGIIVDVLLFTLFVMLVREKERATEYAKHITKDLQLRTDKLEIVTKDLQLRNQALREANRELDQFAYVASHDLKAPLRGISQLVTWLSEELKEFLTPQTEQYTLLLNNRVLRLEKLLDDLLAYSRVGRKQGELAKFNLEEYCTETLELLAPQKSITLHCTDHIGTFETLTTPLELILRNLISNAVKHHDKESGNIYIFSDITESHYQFTVEDDGPGIDKEYRERVFDLFHTLKPRDSVEGSGLGLSIIKKILELYSCPYSLDSNSHGGCTFIFSWPTAIITKEGLG